MVLANLSSSYDEKELNEVMDDLDELIQKEVLFAPMDPNYKMAIEDRPIIKALCLNIAHDCNLRCQYCLQDRAATASGVCSCPLMWQEGA